MRNIDETRMWFDLGILIVIGYIIYLLRVQGTVPGFDVFQQLQSMLHP